MGNGDNETPVKQDRRPAWTRAVDIILRTAHVSATGILLGGAVFQAPFDAFLKWQFPVIITGFALILSEIYHRPHWIVQGRSVMVFMHAGLLIPIRFKPYLVIPLLLASFFIGMAGSHMSRNLRHRSLIGRRPEKE